MKIAKWISTGIAASLMALCVFQIPIVLSSETLKASCLAQNREEIAETCGPLLGSVTAKEARLIYRAESKEQTLTLKLFDANGGEVLQVNARSLPENDFVAKFHLTSLSPDSKYQYAIMASDGELLVACDDRRTIRTLPDDRKNRFSAAFVSCANEKSRLVWREIAKRDVNLLCLNGDTPYIDTSDLALARKKHRNFLRLPELATLVAGTSTLGNWDDHDFGANNGNGASFADHKAKTLKAFKSYRANGSFGNSSSEGIYHKSDHGVIEIFHLDPRYFSQTSPSPVDDSQPTCFGEDQWNWLLQSLENSEATFKVLSMGAIWQDKKNSETDDMFTYWYERDALFDFIKRKKISGVVLLGGDIHCSRYLCHPQRVGYDLHDFIVSPAHIGTIPSLNVYHPSLEWSLVEPNQFLVLTADGTGDVPTLVAEYRQPDGKLNHRVEVTVDDLTSSAEESLQKDLRASWNFDKDFKNRSKLGSRLDAVPAGGAVIEKDSGLSNGALRLKRDHANYVNVPRSILGENSPEHTVSLWIKPTSLPAHDSKARHFVYESTAAGTVSSKAAFHFSLGFRASEKPQDVDLELFTHTIAPAARKQAAPTALAQGGFGHPVNRKSLAQWTHLVITFDSTKLVMFLNGEKVSEFELPVKGPASEHGGLVIGGHREGVGRNFDGLIDEMGIWGRVLSRAEISKLFDSRKISE